MSQSQVNAARRLELALAAHDALKADPPDVDRAAGYLRQAIGQTVPDEPDVPVPPATDLHPFDQAFAKLCRAEGVTAMWVAALDGKLASGGHEELAGAVNRLLTQGMAAAGGTSPDPEPQRAPSGLYLPGPAQLTPGQLRKAANGGR